MAAVRQGDVPVQGWSPGSAPTEAPGRHPTDDRAPRGHSPTVVDPAGTGTPAFAAPGLVLLAAVAVYAGYHWLRLIPSGAPRPTAIVLTVAVVPATYALTRHLSGRATGRVRSVARSCAVLLPALWIVLLVVHRGVVADVLGVVSLALALSSVALAGLAETGDHRRTGPY
jgi:hypothetical protein